VPGRRSRPGAADCRGLLKYQIGGTIVVHAHGIGPAPPAAGPILLGHRRCCCPVTIQIAQAGSLTCDEESPMPDRHRRQSGGR
jgi:hypothetical protein